MRLLPCSLFASLPLGRGALSGAAKSLATVADPDAPVCVTPASASRAVDALPLWPLLSLLLVPWGHRAVVVDVGCAALTFAFALPWPMISPIAFAHLAEGDHTAAQAYSQMHGMIDRAEAGLYRPYPDPMPVERLSLI